MATDVLERAAAQRAHGARDASSRRPSRSPSGDALDDAHPVGRRSRRGWIYALLAVSLVVVVGVGAARSPLLDVDHVRIVGAPRTGSAVVDSAAGVSIGSPMASVDLRAVERRVERLPWVADATVTRDWPGTVRIAVIERVPVAVTDGPVPMLVDGEGRLLASASGVSGLASVGPRPAGSEAGDVLGAAALERLRVVAAMPPALDGQVASVTSSGGRVSLVLDDGILVRVGDLSNLRAKLDLAAVRLAQPDRSTLATIDVSVPGAGALTRRPTGGA